MPNPETPRGMPCEEQDRLPVDYALECLVFAKLWLAKVTSEASEECEIVTRGSLNISGRRSLRNMTYCNIFERPKQLSAQLNAGPYELLKSL